MRLGLYALAALAAPAHAVQVAFQVPSRSLSDLPDYVNSLRKTFRVPGVSIAIIETSESVRFLNSGESKEDGSPSSDDTLYCIASNSKAFLAASLGLLIDDFVSGRNVTPLPPGIALNWDTKAKDILPGEWMLLDDWATEKASLIDLLSHVTGMPRHDVSYSYQDHIGELVHRLRYLRPAHELRETWDYNNQMYMTVSYVIAKYANQSYPAFVKQRIFDPLGMVSSTFHPQLALDSGTLADGFVNNASPGGNQTRRIPYFLKSWSDEAVNLNAGAGGVITNTEDATLWLTMLLNSGTDPTGFRVLPKSVVEMITGGKAVTTGKAAYPELSPMVYGAGWWRESYQGHEVVHHSGSVPGFSSKISMYPSDGLGIITFSNGDAADPALNSLHYRIVEDLLGLERIDWVERFTNESRSAHVVNTASDRSSLGIPLPLANFSGTYFNPGYGSLTLCAWPPTSDICEDVLDEYAKVEPGFNVTKTISLYSAWPKMWCSHLKLTQRNETLFGLSMDSLYPYGYGRDKEPFLQARSDVSGDSYAEFLVQEGAVVGLGVWGVEGGNVRRIPGKPKESSEAWFNKVS